MNGENSNGTAQKLSFFSFFWMSSWRTKCGVLLVTLTGIFILFSSIGAVAFIIHIQKQEPPPEIPKAKATPADFVYEIKNIAFYVTDKKLVRNAYVQFVLSIQCGNEECVRQLELNRAKLFDLVYEVSSPFYIEDFNTPRGMQDFKKLLFKAYVNALGENAPKEIMFRDWVLN